MQCTNTTQKPQKNELTTSGIVHQGSLLSLLMWDHWKFVKKRGILSFLCWRLMTQLLSNKGWVWEWCKLPEQGHRRGGGREQWVRRLSFLLHRKQLTQCDSLQGFARVAAAKLLLRKTSLLWKIHFHKCGGHWYQSFLGKQLRELKYNDTQR